MDIDLYSAPVQQALPAVRALLKGRSKLLCFGDRLLLAAFGSWPDISRWADGCLHDGAGSLSPCGASS